MAAGGDMMKTVGANNNFRFDPQQEGFPIIFHKRTFNNFYWCEGYDETFAATKMEINYMCLFIKSKYIFSMLIKIEYLELFF